MEQTPTEKGATDRYEINTDRHLAEQLSRFLYNQSGASVSITTNASRFGGATEAIVIIAGLTTIAKNALDIWISQDRIRQSRINVRRLCDPISEDKSDSR